MVRMFGLAAPRLARTVTFVVLGTLWLSAPAFAQEPDRFFFKGVAGLILNVVKPDKTAEWEALIDKIVGAMKTSENPARQAQAKSWRILKSTEQPVKEAVLYFWRFDEAPPDAEYSMVKILTELFPKEANAMYTEYSSFYVPPAQQIFHLSVVKDFSK